MKKNSKLLAFVIAIAMVMSMTTIPVCALGAGYVAPTGENLLPIFGYGPYNYENTTNTASAGNIYGFTGPAGAATTTTIGSDCNGGTAVRTEGVGTDNSWGAVNTLSGTAASGPRMTWIPLEAGVVYEVSVDMKINSDTVTSAEVIKMDLNRDTTNSTVIPTATSGTLINKTINNTEFTTVSGYFTTEAYASSNGKRCHTHVTFQFAAGAAPSVITDNWSLKKVPALSAPTMTDNGDCSATYTFNNELDPDEVTASDFSAQVVYNGAAVEGIKIPTLSVTTVGNKCTVRLSDYAYNMKYTVTLKNCVLIKDIYGQTGPSGHKNVFVTTPAAPDVPLMPLNSYDGTFETVETGTAHGTNSGDETVSLTVVEDSSFAYDGSKYLKVSKTTADSKNTVAFVLENGFNYLETYVVSYYVRSSAGTQKVKTAPASVTGSTVGPNNSATPYVEIAADEWTKITDYFTVGGSNDLNRGIEIRIAVNGTGDIYIDNFSVCKMNTLDNVDYFANITKTSNGIEVDITDRTETAPELYCIAAKYDGTGKLVDVILGELNGISTFSKKSTSYLIEGADLDDYKLFIWTTSFNPLNEKMNVSDL